MDKKLIRMLSWRDKDRDDERVDWKRICHEIAHPKIDLETGAEYIDVNQAELAAIDKVAEICKINRVDYPGLPQEEIMRRDDIFKSWNTKAFRYLNL